LTIDDLLRIENNPSYCRNPAFRAANEFACLPFRSILDPQ
jgi:hypothetical protein